QPRPTPNPVTTHNTPSDRGGLAISPDGRLRASEHDNRTIQLWDIVTGRPVGQTIKTGGGAVRMEFSPDSRLLATSELSFGSGPATPGSTLRLWETSTGLPCGPPVPQTPLMADLWFDRDARFL